MFFSNTTSVVRIVVTAALAYMALVILLRISGKRTLAKMNAFDLVVTVALGSSLATVIVSKETTLLDGLTAFAMLIGLQYAVAWISIRVNWFKKLVKSHPKLLFYEGEFLPEEMKRERVTTDEVLAAIRSEGISDLEHVQAVVLETDGSFAVVRRQSGAGQKRTLTNVKSPS